MEYSTILILGTAVLIFGIVFLRSQIQHRQLLNEAIGKDDLNSNLPIKQQTAVVLSKIDAENPTGIFFAPPYIIFETETHERIKLAITDREIYDHILIGDHGVLETKGQAFIRFSREQSS